MFTELARGILLAQSGFHLSSIKTGNRVLLVSLNEKGQITTVAKLSKLYKGLEPNTDMIPEAKKIGGKTSVASPNGGGGIWGAAL